MAGNGNIGAGDKAMARRPGQPTVEGPAETGAAPETRIAEANLLKKERPGICVAMTQQNAEFGRGNQSAPQELLQLVGCRDPNARLVPWVRPRPLPVKR